MVVCKFFQQGNCRYGQNCRFEHIYGSKYSYHANAQPEPVSTTPAVTDDQLVNQVHTDLQSMVRGGQWLLSSYAPFKEKPTFPGLTDMSPEEARLFIYEAKANNNVDQAVTFMNKIFQEQKQKYETLLQKSPSITKVLRSLYNGENVSSPFTNQSSAQPFGSSDASSVFRSAAQSQPSVFAQNTPSMFDQNNSFATDPAKSIFSQASQSLFQNQNQTPSIFGTVSNPPTQQMSVFGQTDPQSIFAQATQNVFGQNSQPTQDVFGTQSSPSSNAQNIFAAGNASSSIFGQQQTAPLFNQQNAPTNVFQKSEPQNQNVFGATNSFPQQTVADTGIYSRLEDISVEDLEAFESDEFKMGFVPDVPPPKSLCV